MPPTSPLINWLKHELTKFNLIYINSPNTTQPALHHLPASTMLPYKKTKVAIGLINHNVTYLLSSDFPALRNGFYRPMPFRASSGSPTNMTSTDEDNAMLSSISKNEPISATVLSNCSNIVLNTTQSPMRSRSGSYASNSSLTLTTGAIQRIINSDIKEELDIDPRGL